MANLTHPRKGQLSSWTQDLFDKGNFLSPRFLSSNGDLDFANNFPSVNITENEKEYKNEMASLGYKIIKDFDRPDKDIVEGFADFSSTAISDVIGKLFTMSNEIKPLYKPIKKVS